MFMNKRLETTTEIKTISAYLEQDDITIIFEHTYINGVLTKTELRGFYWGRPNQEDTERNITKGVVCNYV